MEKAFNFSFSVKLKQSTKDLTINTKAFKKRLKSV